MLPVKDLHLPPGNNQSKNVTVNNSINNNQNNIIELQFIELQEKINQRLYDVERRLESRGDLLNNDLINVKINKMHASIDERFNELIFKIAQKVDKGQYEHALDKIWQAIKDIKNQMKRFPDKDDIFQTIIALDDGVRYTLTRIEILITKIEFVKPLKYLNYFW